jgi:type IV pilus assembly protein PilX
MSLYRQRGAVLVVSLLILLVVSILGVTSLTTTSMEEKMASNTRQERIAFEAAEAALRAAEDWLRANITNRTQIPGRFNGSSPGLYSQIEVHPFSRSVPDAGLQTPSYANWTTGTRSVEVATLPMFPAGTTQRPRYIIEYVGRVDTTGVGGPLLDYEGGADMRQYAFRITAIGWGLDTSAHHLLESTYRMPL